MSACRTVTEAVACAFQKERVHNPALVCATALADRTPAPAAGAGTINRGTCRQNSGTRRCRHASRGIVPMPASFLCRRCVAG